MFELLAKRSNANPNLARHCAYEPLLVEVHAGGESEYVRIDGEGITVSAEPPLAEPDIVLSASRDAWEQHQRRHPEPGFQALSTMRRSGHLTVGGNLLAYHRHLLMLEMVFTPAERQQVTTAQVPSEPFIEAVTGRYLNLDIGGRHHRVYFEEAGDGPALLCLHTAGSDARQYRHVLNDTEVTKHFRVIAFDMPWHGKSSPPAGFESEVYSLTTEHYVELVMAVKRALALDKPIVMGCSIGGRVVLHLALRHGEELGAVIGLQSALFAEDRSGNAEDATRMVLHRPDVHSNEVAGALMNGVMAPQSPTHERWETMWHYMQGGPGIFAGDLNYYFTDGDLRNGGAAGIDVAKCPVYLLSGEYDPSATPEMGQALAEEIGATYFEVMNAMGHFPMSENPGGFRTYLLRVLAMIRAQ